MAAHTTDLIMHVFDVSVRTLLASNGSMDCVVRGCQRADAFETVQASLEEQYNRAGKSFLVGGTIVQHHDYGGTTTRYMADWGNNVNHTQKEVIEHGESTPEQRSSEDAEPCTYKAPDGDGVSPTDADGTYAGDQPAPGADAGASGTGDGQPDSAAVLGSACTEDAEDEFFWFGGLGSVEHIGNVYQGHKGILGYPKEGGTSEVDESQLTL